MKKQDIMINKNKLIIMRGIPGAGKSTLAKKLIGEGIIHSTDTLIEDSGNYNKFFENLKGTDGSALGKMHSTNLRNAKASINLGITPVIIDNTNIRPSDVKPYVEYAIKKGYVVEIADVGTSGLKANELAERNTHGVTEEKINSMIQSYNSFGEMTVKKILESKSRHKAFVWSGVKLDDKSRGRLLSKVGHKIPQGWKTIAEHMTLTFGKTLESINRGDLIGERTNLKVIGIGISDMALAVEVEGFKDIINERRPHITIAINESKGAKPVMSNDIQKWVKFSDLDESYITLTGTVTQIKN